MIPSVRPLLSFIRASRSLKITSQTHFVKLTEMLLLLKNASTSVSVLNINIREPDDMTFILASLTSKGWMLTSSMLFKTQCRVLRCAISINPSMTPGGRHSICYCRDPLKGETQDIMNLPRCNFSLNQTRTPSLYGGKVDLKRRWTWLGKDPIRTHTTLTTTDPGVSMCNGLHLQVWIFREIRISSKVEMSPCKRSIITKFVSLPKSTLSRIDRLQKMRIFVCLAIIDVLHSSNWIRDRQRWAYMSEWS